MKKPAKKEPPRKVGHKLIAGYDPDIGADGCWYDAAAGQRTIDFFEELLRHIEGSTAGHLFKLEPWQKIIIETLFGWKKKDAKGREVRRYRETFLEMPRKNGKTPLAAGMALYLFFCDNEPGAQVFCAAADTEQAAMLFRHARGMVEAEPELEKRCDIFRGTGHRSIVLKNDPGAFFRVMSSDANTKHGGNTHAVIIDELHAQKNRELVDVLQTSMASDTRKQPLMIFITTSDFDRISICNEKYDYACKVRDGIIRDVSFLPVIYEALPTEDWTSSKVWAKANPNLGVSVSIDYMKRECLRAQETPAYENTFKRLHLNIRTAQDIKLIDMTDWDNCPSMQMTDEQLKDEPCFAALDLSSTTDLAALALFFPNQNTFKLRFWCPGDNAPIRERRDRVPYLTWSKAGLIELTPGNVIDYKYIIAEIIRLREQFTGLRTIAYDPWNARQTAIELQDEHDFKMIEFRQGFVSMNEPTKQFLSLIKSKRANHGGNQILRWMASNATARTDPADNIKIDKAKSRDKVDGLIACVMALGLSMTEGKEQPSAYSNPDGGVLYL